jgi:enoyl-CoA hydratase/carnithine racemase
LPRYQAHNPICPPYGFNAVVEKSQTLERALQLALEVTARAPIAVRHSLAIAKQAFDESYFARTIVRT